MQKGQRQAPQGGTKFPSISNNPVAETTDKSAPERINSPHGANQQSAWSGLRTRLKQMESTQGRGRDSPQGADSQSEGSEQSVRRRRTVSPKAANSQSEGGEPPSQSPAGDFFALQAGSSEIDARQSGNRRASIKNPRPSMKKPTTVGKVFHDRG